MWIALIFAATPVVHVQAGAPLGGNGSAERPFTRVGDALAAAPDGATIAIETGLYEGPLELGRRVRLEGHGQVVLAAPADAEVAIRIRSDATLANLSVQGGRVGVQIQQGAAQLEHVRLRGQPEVAIVCDAGAHCELVDVELQSSFAQAIGLRGPGVIDVKRVHIAGPFRRAVELKDGTLTGEDLEIQGPVTGVHAIGSKVSLKDARFDDLRGSCTFASAGTLELGEPVFTGCDVAVEVREGAKVTLTGAIASGCKRAVVASTEAHVVAHDLAAVGPSRDAALMLVGGDAELDDVRIRRPGTVAVMARGAKVHFRNLVVDDVRADHDDFGNALFLYASTVDGQDLLARRCEGPAIEAQLGSGRMEDVVIEQAGLAGLALEHQAELRIDGLELRGAPNAGLACIENSKLQLRGYALREVHEPYLIDCSCEVTLQPNDSARPTCSAK
ncbi:MAG: hypothetical protein JST54_26015 [Deltaproteobacteria bacterium]|nr:hypothetical protein [Deltaproteobacteria bacterium]